MSNVIASESCSQDLNSGLPNFIVRADISN